MATFEKFEYQPGKFCTLKIHRPDLAAARPHSPVPASQLVAASLEAPPPPQLFAGDGPALWARLHCRALELDLASFNAPAVDDSGWLAEFEALLPCGHCRAHWHQMLVQTPPRFDQYFAWTVDRHNEVNAKLGKKTVPVIDALAIWAPILGRKAVIPAKTGAGADTRHPPTP